MAGDWLKMRIDLWDHPKVVRILSAICPQSVRDLSAKCRVIGALFRTWSLADAFTTDGILEGYDADALDAAVGIEGWSANMQHVGWLIIEPQRLIVPRFETHNGKSAKRRAEDSSRKKSVRKTSAKRPQNVRKKSDKMRTREEKRREDNKSNTRSSNSAPNGMHDWQQPDAIPDHVGTERKFPIPLIPVPTELETLEFRKAWNSWLSHMTGKWKRGPTQASLEANLILLKPFGPMIASLAIYEAITANVSDLEPDRAEKRWRAWLASELAELTMAEFSKAKQLDRWWRNRAPAHLRGHDGRLLCLASAFQAIEENKTDPLTTFVRIMSDSDPWGEIASPQRDKAVAFLAKDSN